MSEPVSIDRFKQELEKLKSEMDSGKMKHGEYDQRLARILQELREAKLDSDRPHIAAMLDDVLRRGVITGGVKSHIEARLGLTHASGE